MPSEAELLAELARLLEPRSNPGRAIAAQLDKGSSYRFLAIRVPVLRQIALREFDLSMYTLDQRLRIFDYIWMRSNDYEALSVPLLYYRKLASRIRQEDFAVIRNWIGRVDDWGHADDLAAIYSYCCENWPELVTPFLKFLNGRSDLWSIRVSIVSLVHYSGKNAVFLKPGQVTPLLDRHLESRQKYIANAVGWVLREMHKVYPLEIGSYVSANARKISSLARRKSGL